MKIKKYFVFLIIILASFIASRDLFKPGYFPMHDDLQTGRLYEMELCFRDGQIPCRWSPDMGFSYGYPLFNYYPPFPYYLGMVFRLLGVSAIGSIKILFILGFFLSAVFMFILGKELWGEIGGLVASIFYLFSPYHAVDIYVRGAMNEFWALTWFPLIFWAVLKIVKGKDNKFVPLLALSYGLLLLTHNVMTMLFTPLVVVWGILLIWSEKKKWQEKIFRLAVGGVWGIGIAAFFILPVIFEGKFVHTETMLMGYFNYLAHFVGLKKTLFTRFWGYGSSGWLQEAGMPFQVGFPQWPVATVVFLLCLFLFLKKKLKLGNFLIYGYLYFIFLFSLFMVHARSVFIWDRLPFLSYVQFPWRFLALTMFGMSVVSGGVIKLVKERRRQIILGVLLIVLTILLNYSFFRPEKIVQVTDEEKLFSAKGWKKLQTDGIFDYLPKYAQYPPGGPAPQMPEIKIGKTETSEIKKGTNWYVFKARVIEQSKIQIPLYDFPGWKVWTNGKLAEIKHDNLLGLITINLSPGDYLVKAKLTDTPVRIMGNFISLVSLLILFWSVFKVFKKSRVSVFK